MGYCRVSTQGQNPQRQIVALEEKGAEKIFMDKLSGKNKNRPQLQDMMNFIREGDTLVVESISRLARNTKDFLEIVYDLTEKGVEVISLKENIDTATVQGKFICTVFGALYELERESTRQRQREGIELAKANGVPFGRPPIQVDHIFMSEYQKWKSGEQTAVSTYKKLDISRSSFYRKVKHIERSASTVNLQQNIKNETTMS
ncbi:recombinase family protein [Jeotgalibacillus sp. JSM ZJ347]|uniref:recombinase family protein n=1 Tax=Jeotgalibacillus sp. JSM ZJ347 TaxID=3342117 RepID=UPI0035A97019